MDQTTSSEAAHAPGPTREPQSRLSPSEVAETLAWAKAFGVDLDALRDNLELTTVQRLQKLQAALRSVGTLRNARKL
jgi:hypothetical protein